MAIVRLIILTLAAVLAAPSTIAQEGESVVRSEAARTEIERILNADNLDSNRMSPREVADTISLIEQGRAPDDFWEAYQAHVRAWQNFADTIELAQFQADESGLGDGAAEVTAAEDAIERTFDEVRRIARRYGARLPTPPVDTRAIA